MAVATLEPEHSAPPIRLAYSVREAAEALGMAKQSVQNLINDGTLRSVKLGGRRVIPASALAELLGD
jgi:excisionase family DNA binding protein